MRGEILFARCWLLCEGQTEYILLHQFSMILNQQLDANAVAVIDYQNNGSPGAFASCARVLGFKWVMFSDGDAAGKGFIQELKNYHFTDDQIAAAVKTFPAADIEALVATSTLAADCRACLTEHNVNVFPDGAPGASENLAHELRSKKPDWASWLAGHLADRDADDTVVPDFFKEIIASAVKLAHE
jgi:putative ATP-dependent endonuclease of OLD family